METVRITSAAVAHPHSRMEQEDVARAMEALGFDGRRAAAVARNSRITTRAIALTMPELTALGSIESRNDRYHCLATNLAFRATRKALGEARRDSVACLVTSSVTGYSVPSWGVELVEGLGLPCTTVRLPITEAGCAGGALALARATDYLRSRPNRSALVTAVEVCSLSFHPGGDEGNLLSSLIFADGAGAARLETGEGGGLEVLDSLSMLIPRTGHALGFNLTDTGFYPVLSRELTEILTPALPAAIGALLRQNGLEVSDVGAWLIHPGGARILSMAESRLGLQNCQLRWSWESLAEFGNTSSSAVLDVLQRYMAEGPRPGEIAVLAAFGPGVSIELVLLRQVA